VSLYSRLAELQARGQAAALCTVIRTVGSVPRQVGAKMLVLPTGRIEGTIGGGAMEARVIEQALLAINDGQPRTLEYSLAGDASRGDPGICGGTLEVFVEPVQPQPTLLIIGAGHVGRALAKLADFLGYRIVLSDDRAEFATAAVVPEADEFYPVAIADLPAKFKITPHTYIVLTTRNAEVDVAGLPALLDSPAAYFGVIGSRKRWAQARQRMEAAGVDSAKLDAVHSPTGLELNAESPEEIAVSIMAELIMLRRGGDGSSMNSKK
jgi:xanthine dehydrogenase accessory factor